MAFLNFLFKPKNELERGGRDAVSFQSDEQEPEKTCPNCRRGIPISELWAHKNVCPHCAHHFRMSARQRLEFLADKDSFEELFADIKSVDPINFEGYQDKLRVTKAVSKEGEAVLCGTAKIGGCKCCIFVMEAFFMMGSMGCAVGERITRLFEYALEKRLPVVGFSVSGGARMQEGLYSLMQMAKTSAAVKRHGDAGLFYLSVLTHPTTGGVTASFAMSGDIILAEPGATICFAGPRVIEQTIRKPLPKGFQTSEFLLEHGFIDAIVSRLEHKEIIGRLLAQHSCVMAQRSRDTAQQNCNVHAGGEQ